jgi:hypothetical protein
MMMMFEKVKKSRPKAALEVLTGRRQTEWTGATQNPERLDSSVNKLEPLIPG